MNYTLNEMQKLAVQTINGPVAVSAGAGSGKTRVLVYRIVNLIKNYGVNPINILAVTFTNKAAQEMKDRIENELDCPCPIWAYTFHSLCTKILRKYAYKIEGYNSNFTIYDESDKKQIIKNIAKDNNFDDIDSNDVSDKISYRKNGCSCEFNNQQFEYIYSKYNEILKSNNAFDFDDLLISAYSILKSDEEAREYYQNMFKYILIDEFQDTNDIQYNIAILLSEKFNNIFIVGDENQSIYSWRGAKKENIQLFVEHFANCKIIKLEQNYRSTKKIINAANIIISKSDSFISKTLFTENSEGVKLECYSARNDWDEAEYIAQNIYALTKNGYSFSDIAVLFRVNSLSRKIEEKLLDYNIPYQIFGGFKFFERVEIKCVLCYLKCLVNVYDDASFLSIINTPKRNFGDTSIDKFKQLTSGNYLNYIYNISEDTDIEPKLKTKLIEIKNMFLDLKEKMSFMTLSKFVEYLITETKIYSYYEKSENNKIYNIIELVKSVQEFEKNNPSSTLSDYIQSVSLIADIDTYDDKNNSVILSTIHSAKGLEFKTVFIAGLEEKIFPLVRDKGENDLEEERRLMYVAITRAKERLYFTHCKTRRLYNQDKMAFPSIYLDELQLVRIPKTNVSHSPSLTSMMFKPINAFATHSFCEISNEKDNLQTQYKSGDKVFHEKLGEGIVVICNEKDNQVVINFKGIGTKAFSLISAPIKKVN